MITVSLIGGGSPPLVQIVISATPTGEAWELTGSGGGIAWTVPGGAGVGDGQSLVLADNRAPLNTPVMYTLAWAGGSQSSSPVTVPTVGDVDVVLQSLDGQVKLPGRLQDGTQALRQDPGVSLYRVPGRRSSVSRYAASGVAFGSLIFRCGISDTETMDRLLESSAPVLVRYASKAMDLPLVQVVHFTGISSTAHLVAGFREWELPYVPVDDPFMDQRIGAFTWDYTDALQVQGSTIIRDAVAMEAALAGLTGDQTDAFDWSVLA